MSIYADYVRELRRMLASLYPDVEQQRRVVQEAGIDTGGIAFLPAAYSSWSEILRYTEPRNLTAALVDFAIEENPTHVDLPRIRAAAQVGAPWRAPELAEIDQWRGAPGSLEQLMGHTSTLVDVAYLAGGLQRARSVVFVMLAEGGSGSGFITDGELLVTNHHVLPSREVARAARIRCNYQRSVAGVDESYEDFELDPDAYFATSGIEAHDCTVVRIAGEPSKRWGSIEIHPLNERAKALQGEFVNVIQHAGGGPKQVSLAASIVAAVGGDRVQYLTDTLPGSSGSPVFDARWRVVALHSRGGNLTEPSKTKGRVFWRNEGVLIDRIVELLPRG